MPLRLKEGSLAIWLNQNLKHSLKGRVALTGLSFVVSLTS